MTCSAPPITGIRAKPARAVVWRKSGGSGGRGVVTVEDGRPRHATTIRGQKVGSGVIEFVFDTLEYVHQGPTALQRPSRHREAVRRRAPQPPIEELRQIADSRNDILA